MRLSPNVREAFRKPARKGVTVTSIAQTFGSTKKSFTVNLQEAVVTDRKSAKTGSTCANTSHAIALDKAFKVNG